MRIFLLMVFSLWISILISQSSSIYFAEHPCLTPDGSAIIFTYDSDLWQVSSSGGLAKRITALEGKESMPKVSPDGKWLAFSSNQYDNNDVYIMPLEGGKITQLTFHEANDEVSSWSWNSQMIYFNSNRYNRISTYAVNTSGETPKRLFENFFNTIHNAMEHPYTSEIYFNESWESSIFTHRKRYKGPYDPDVKSYNTKTQELTTYTDYEGKDMWTTIDKNGNIYFVSDRDNDEYNLYQLKGREVTALTNYKTAIFNPCVSADGSAIVYMRDYQIMIYDVNSKKEKRVDIQVSDYDGLDKLQEFKVDGNITSFDISDDGKKMAFVSRGELFIADKDGKFVKQLFTNPQGRVLEVQWLSDHETIIFNQTVNGFQNWFTIAANKSVEAKQLTNELRNNRNIAFNKDKTQAVYLSGRDEVRLIDLKTFESSLLTKDELWGLYNDMPQWSPDDAYVMYTAIRDFESDIMLIDMKTKQVTNLTMTGVAESSPSWSPDGKAIYFSSNRHEPSYPRGGGETDLYKLPLTKITAPFKSDKVDLLFVDEGAQKQKDSINAIVKVEIDFEKVMDRLETVGPTFGSQSGAYILQDKDESTVLYISDHEEGSNHLYKTVQSPYESDKTTLIAGPSANSLSIEAADDQLYILVSGDIYKINLSSDKLDKIDVSYTFERDLKNEFSQMYFETWANLDENFYSDDMHGVDWAALKTRYAAFLPYVKNRDNLRTLTNDLLGELNTSHFGFNSSGDEEETHFNSRTSETGLKFENDNPYMVASIIENGPCDASNVDIQPGDRIVKVNGKAISSSMNREYYFSLPSVSDELSLTLTRNGKTIEEKIHPISYRSNVANLYDEWIEENQKRVDEQTDKKVAYVYMKNMGSGSLDGFLNEMVSEWYNREALILDLRYNTGGNVHNDVLQFLSQHTYLQWKYRGGKLTPQPNFSPADKPIVLLINEQSLSDAEMTTEGFKKLKLGTVVGTPTYRWIIFTSGKGLVDGSFYRLPSWGCYSLSGDNLEKTGVEPDVYINNTMSDRLKGEDPQLDRAIQIIKSKMRE